LVRGSTRNNINEIIYNNDVYAEPIQMALALNDPFDNIGIQLRKQVTNVGTVNRILDHFRILEINYCTDKIHQETPYF
jgi:hypothetical protein